MRGSHWHRRPWSPWDKRCGPPHKTPRTDKARGAFASRLKPVPTKVQELRQDHRGDRRQCVLCNPPDPAKAVTMDRLWSWSMANPGESPFR